MKGKRSNELVKVVAHGVNYEVQEEHLHTSISGYEIRDIAQPADPTDSASPLRSGPRYRRPAPQPHCTWY